MPVKTIEEILKDTKIHQILRPKLVMALPGLSLQEALDLMHHERSGYIVVADEHSKLVGMFTEREVLMKVLVPGVSLNDALEIMNKFGVRHVPLVDEFGQVNGILSIRTIVSFLAELFPTGVFNLPPKADQIHNTIEGG